MRFRSARRAKHETVRILKKSAPSIFLNRQAIVREVSFRLLVQTKSFSSIWSRCSTSTIARVTISYRVGSVVVAVVSQSGHLEINLMCFECVISDNSSGFKVKCQKKKFELRLTPECKLDWRLFCLLLIQTCRQLLRPPFHLYQQYRGYNVFKEPNEFFSMSQHGERFVYFEVEYYSTCNEYTDALYFGKYSTRTFKV